MTTIRIFDTESDALAKDATKLWCISSIDYEDEEDAITLFDPTRIHDGLSHLHQCDVLVCHNLIGHDLPLLKKLYGWEPLSHQIVLDTLVFSRTLYPKRPKPINYSGKSTHSIEAWGYRLGRGKPEHEDWSKYTPEMGHRCKEDVIINRMILKELERESEEQKMFYHEAATKRRA